MTATAPTPTPSSSTAESVSSELNQATYLKISGMRCAGCARGISRRLSQTVGIQLADVNFAAEQARVIYRPSEVSVDDMIHVVQDGGFDAAPLEDVHNQDPTADIEDRIQSAWYRFLLGAIPVGILMGVMLVCMAMGMEHNLHHHALTLTLAFPVVFVAGWPTHRASWAAVRQRALNMDVLISLSTLPTYLVGLLGFAEVTVFVEVAAMVMAFHLLGRYLEQRARGRASQAIRKLIDMQVKYAHLQRSTPSESEAESQVELVDVPIEMVQVGDHLVVKPGESIPADGRVVKGSSTVNESMATGEAMPVLKQPGAEVIGATINQQGRLVIEVTRTGQDTFLAQMIRLIQEAQGSKIPIQAFADEVTGFFVPGVITLAILTFSLWMVAADPLREWLHSVAATLPWINTTLSPLGLATFNMIAVLVIACPCALGLATPIALMVGSGRGAELGILIRQGEAIQTLKSTTKIVLDKTGTVTTGELKVTQLAPTGAIQALKWAAIAEQGSEHPVGRAIVQEADVQGFDLPDLDHFEAVIGRGVEAQWGDHRLLVGNLQFLSEHGIDMDPWQEQWATLEDQGQTVIGVTRNGEVLGLIALADTLKPDSIEAVAKFQRMGLDPILVTGDNERTAQAIARQLGIETVYAGVLPGGKVDVIRTLQDAGHQVIMVGDGLNDAPALTQADVGIAIGTGTDLAIEAADLAVVQGTLSAVVKSVNLARATFAKIRQNLAWAYGYNLIAIPLAAAGLLHPIMAEIAMALSSLTVIWNSLRLRQDPID